MKLYGTSRALYNASNWYRTIMPWRTAQNMKLADPIIDQTDLKVENEIERRMHATIYSDIVQHYQLNSTMFTRSKDSCNQLPSYWQDKDKWNVPPSFVFDTDDDLFRVEPMNPSFRILGQHIDGRELEPGEKVRIEDDQGNLMSLYEDGKDDFDIARNKKVLGVIRDNMKAADLVTCSTEGAAEYVRRETGRDDMYVYPNCIDFKDWPMVRLAEDGVVRILWQSSATHFEDMWPLRKVLGRVHRKYKNVEIIIFGSPYPWLLRELVEDRTRVMGWTSYSNYILYMSMLGHDINLAPLHDSEFNRSRSAIRMYESAACWKPAATLAERTGPFAKELIEGETGMLFSDESEFETKLCALIEDASLRRTIAENAKDWVRTYRDPYIHVPKLLERYEQLRNNKRAGYGPPPPAESDLVTVPTTEEQP